MSESKEKLGKRIKRFRELNEITLQELADRTGLGIDFLASLEQDSVYPSLGPLLKVARGLGVRLGTFLDDEVGQDPLIVHYAERQEELSMLRGKGRSADLKFFSLGKGKTDRHMEPFVVEIMPGSAEDRSLSSHEGEEFILVQSGRIEVVYGQNTYVLGVGDSIYLNSVVPHHVGCSGDEPARILAVLYFPE